MDAFWLGLWDLSVLTKLALALVLGGGIGLEREFKGRPAGLRTHVLVCLGATILLIASRGVGLHLAGQDELHRTVLDPDRIAAGIVTGIGFLGAGAILRTGDLIRGLTTGATIWFVAALGIVIGNGLYPLATAATVIVVLVLEAFDVLEHRIPPVVYRSLHVVLPAAQHVDFEPWCRAFLRGRGIRVQEVLCSLDIAEQTAELTFRIRARAHRFTTALADGIGSQPGITRIAMEQE